MYGSEQASQQSREVQQHVTGESSTADYGFSSLGPFLNESKEPESHFDAVEPSFADKPDVVEALERGEVQPPPTSEVRRYSADWDAMQ